MKLLKVFTVLTATLALTSQAWAVGAIAADSDAGETDAGYGIYVNASTKKEAESGAMKFCKEAGNKNCEIVLNFKKCGAYAVSKDVYGVGEAASKDAAAKIALKECGKGCKLIVSDCED